MKKLIVSLSIMLAAAGGFGLADSAFAQVDPNPLEAACDEIGDASPACQESNAQTGGFNQDPIAGPNGIIQKAANLIGLVAGIAAVVYLIFGGFAFITAGGDQQKVATARTRVLNSIIGLVVIALAWAIVSLVTKFILQT